MGAVQSICSRSQPDGVLYRQKREGPLLAIPKRRVSQKRAINLCSQKIISLTLNPDFLSCLESLQLCCNSLEEVPAEIFCLVRLKSLSLTENRLTLVPEQLGRLAELIELNLAHNQISAIPRSIVLLKNLASLSISHNKIQSLPQEIGYLNQLKILDIANNPIRVLPVEIKRLQQLERIVYADCTFFNYHEDFSKYHTVQTPSLMNCCIKALVKSQLLTQETLQKLLCTSIATIRECSTCSSPVFEENCLKRIQFIRTQGLYLPYEHVLCRNHWNDDRERIECMFSTTRERPFLPQLAFLKH